MQSHGTHTEDVLKYFGRLYRAGHRRFACRAQCPEEVAEWQKRDPVLMFARVLINEGLATAEQLQDMERTLEEELDAAVEFAENSPLPEPEEATTDVYSETSAVVDKTSQTVTGEARPKEDLVRKYWEETDK